MTLKEMTDTSRLSKGETQFLNRLKRAAPEAPCMAVWAVAALYELGMDDFEVQANYPKLAGRPVGSVLAFLANLEGRAPESWQYHITRYAKQPGRLE